MMKRNLLLAGLSALVCGCGPKDERPVVGVSLLNLANEFIVEIDHVDGNIAYLKHPVPYDMALSEARVFSLDMLDNVSLGNFTLTYDLGTDNTVGMQTLACSSGTCEI